MSETTVGTWMKFRAILEGSTLEVVVLSSGTHRFNTTHNEHEAKIERFLKNCSSNKKLVYDITI
jgi:hypothetical protein